MLDSSEDLIYINFYCFLLKAVTSELWYIYDSLCPQQLAVSYTVACPILTLVFSFLLGVGGIICFTAENWDYCAPSIFC